MIVLDTNEVIILDTNIVSALMQSERNAELERWLNRQPPDIFWLTAVSYFELRVGIERLAIGRHRQRLEEALERVLEIHIQNEILPVDERAAGAAASIAATRERIGRPVDFRDTLIAGIVTANRADLATRNVRHFQDLDVSVVNPFAD
ncbi:MAG TPA: PIN domain-containing protein [Xanthobacteraceae bacterium]|nr:PIN domain-containing protein [Xanthobacteraceae bacterium]